MTLKMITFRKATMDDAADLLKWKNEFDTRMNSIVTTDEIKGGPHLIWLANTLADRSVEFLIIELGGEAIGDLRLNHSEREIEVSIRMDKKFRGQGLATQVIGLITEPGKKPLAAKIVAQNLASMRVFISNGYRPEEYVQGPVNYYVFKRFA